MARFVDITDFESGELFLSNNNNKADDLQDYIDRIEPRVLKSLLGSTLYSEFVADWDAVPIGQFSESRFGYIFNAFDYDDDCMIIESDGVKKMLMYFIYYEYVDFITFQKRTTGTKKTKSENSEIAGFTEQGLFEKYNKAIDTYQTIQYYIRMNESEYPEYNGQGKEHLSWL